MARRLPVLLGIGFVALYFPLPISSGIWYVGSRPQWMISIDSGGLFIGHSDGSWEILNLTVGTLILLKSLVVLFVIWAALRQSRSRQEPDASPT